MFRPELTFVGTCKLSGNVTKVVVLEELLESMYEMDWEEEE